GPAMATQVIAVERDGDDVGWPVGRIRARKTIVQADPIDTFRAWYDVTPCLLITRHDPGHPWRKHVEWKRGTHPLQIELQLLLSVKGDGANGWYDVLKEG